MACLKSRGTTVKFLSLAQISDTSLAYAWARPPLVRPIPLVLISPACCPATKYDVSGSVLLRHWMTEFMKHVLPRLASPHSPRPAATAPCRAPCPTRRLGGMSLLKVLSREKRAPAGAASGRADRSGDARGDAANCSDAAKGARDARLARNALCPAPAGRSPGWRGGGAEGCGVPPAVGWLKSMYPEKLLPGLMGMVPNDICSRRRAADPADTRRGGG